MSELQTGAPQAPFTYKLKHPVELRTTQGHVVEKLEELVLKRLNGASARRCLNAAGKGAGDFTAMLVCESAGIPPSTFDQLDAEDITAAAEVATVFFGTAPATSSR